MGEDTNRNHQPSMESRFLTIMALDRARKRWRLGAILFFVILLFIGITNNQQNKVAHSEHIARININGMILQSLERDARLEQLSHDDKVKALIVHIDSPGGTMVGGLSLMHALDRFNPGKPVIVVMDTIAASAGYLSSLSADHIIANEATLTGSIGVLLPLIDASELAQKIGVKPDAITSGDLKLITSPLQKRSVYEKNHLQLKVDSLQDIFLSYVKNYRNISETSINLIQDGRVLIGKEAFNLGLVDALGDEFYARDFLEKTYKISKSMPIVTYALEKHENFIERIMTKANMHFAQLWPSLGITAHHGAWAVGAY